MSIDIKDLKRLARKVAECEDRPEIADEHAEAADALWLHMHCHTILRLIAEIERLESAKGDPVGSFDKHMEYMQENIRLKAENEALRKQIADLWPLKNVPPQDFRASNKCLACGEYHHGLSGLPCPKMTPVAQAFAGVNQRVVPVEPLRIPHPLEAMAKEASHDR